MARIGDSVSVQVKAFLDMIAMSEIGAEMLADPRTDLGYRVIVGSRPDRLILLESYANHPQVLFLNLNSTAAGRYQFLRGTWAGVAGELNLPDFSPVSQDRAAIQRIKERGALTAVENGDLTKAIQLCSSEWASLPGNTYGQGSNSETFLANAYSDALKAYTA